MLHEPELLILDEPFSGLDPVNVELLKQAVKDLNAQGTTIILVHIVWSILKNCVMRCAF